MWIPIFVFRPDMENALKNGEMPMNQVREVIVKYRKKLHAGCRRAVVLLAIGLVCPAVVFLFEKALGDWNAIFFVGLCVGLFGAMFQFIFNFMHSGILCAAAKGYPGLCAQSTEELENFTGQWRQYLS